MYLKVIVRLLTLFETQCIYEDLWYMIVDFIWCICVADTE